MNNKQLAQIEKEKRRMLDSMAEEVKELELKARFWKAQVDIRKFSLEYETLETPYTEYTERQKIKQQELQAEKQKQLEELQKVLDEQAKVELKEEE